MQKKSKYLLPCYRLMNGKLWKKEQNQLKLYSLALARCMPTKLMITIKTFKKSIA